MSRYGFEESIRDGATMPLHFEPRLLELHIDKEAIDEAFKELTGGLSDLDRDQLAKTAAKMAVLVKSPERIQTICADIARHFQEKVAPERLRGAGGHLRPRELRALQEGARRVPAAGGVRHRHDGEQRRGPSTRPTAATGTPRRSCSTASATRPTR